MRLFRGLGRRFGWLWAAYAASAYGTWLGFGAFSFIAIRVLHASAAEVASLSASGLAVGAVIAVPLGPWIEFRHKRPVMIATDLARFTAQASIPLSYAFGVLSIGQMIGVSVVLAAANIAFTAASGAFLKALVEPTDLLVANARFESTTWSASVVGPPLGGAAIGLLGPVVTVAADAASYLLCALGVTAIGGGEPAPPLSPSRLTPAGLGEGWRYLLRHRQLRMLFANSIVVNGLIMAGEAPLAVLMLGPLGFAPWQYGLAFAVPCIGGLIGSRLARPLAERYGTATVLRAFGWLRAVWPLGLVLVQPGWLGLLVVIITELVLIICCSIFGPVSATYRLQTIDNDRVSRVLTAWTVTSTASRAALIALWGLLADATSPRWALATAGVLLLATPLLLPRAATEPSAASGKTTDAGPGSTRSLRASGPARWYWPAAEMIMSWWSGLPRPRWQSLSVSGPGNHGFMSTSTTQTDVITFLIHQHREVDALFTQLEKAEGSTSDEVQRLAERVVISLVKHSAAEEMYLYPAVREHLPDGDEIADHEVREHDEAEQTMKRLESLKPVEATFWPTMRELIREVRHHVREEEDTLFPKLRRMCSDQRLRELGKKVEQAERVAPTRPHPSSPSEGAGLAAMAPGAGLVDRLRDALSGRGQAPTPKDTPEVSSAAPDQRQLSTWIRGESYLSREST